MTRYVASLVGWEGSGTRGGSLLRGEQWSSRDARGDMRWWGLTRSRSVSVPRSRGDVISGGSAIHSSFSRSLAHSISPPRSFFISVPLFVSLSSSILSFSFSLPALFSTHHAFSALLSDWIAKWGRVLTLSVPLYSLRLSFLSLFSPSLSADVCFIFFLYSPFLRSCALKLGLVRRLLEASRLYFFISRFPCYIRRALRRDARGHTRGISVLHKYVAFSYRGRRKGRDVFAYELN